jgi:hypothetical protein
MTKRKAVAQNRVSEAQRDFLQACSKFDSRISTRPDLRDIYRLARLVCVAYISPENWVGENPIEPFPKDMASRVQELCGWLNAGRVPRVMSAVVGRGDPKPPPPEHRDQMRVAAYVHAEKLGTIIDRSPVKRMADACGRKRQTIQNWYKEFMLQTDRDQFLTGNVTEAATVAADRLLRNGRSIKAIEQRGKAPKRRRD